MKAFLIAACAVVAVLCAAPKCDAGAFRKGATARRESSKAVIMTRGRCAGGTCR
jgi:hypothetical protein